MNKILGGLILNVLVFYSDVCIIGGRGKFQVIHNLFDRRISEHKFI